MLDEGSLFYSSKFSVSLIKEPLILQGSARKVVWGCDQKVMPQGFFALSPNASTVLCQNHFLSTPPASSKLLSYMTVLSGPCKRRIMNKGEHDCVSRTQ